jgi:hypothetical protein
MWREPSLSTRAYDVACELASSMGHRNQPRGRRRGRRDPDHRVQERSEGWADKGRLNIQTSLGHSRWMFADGMGALEETVTSFEESYPGARRVAELYLEANNLRWQPRMGMNLNVCFLVCLSMGLEDIQYTVLNSPGKRGPSRARMGFGASLTFSIGTPRSIDSFTATACDVGCIGAYKNLDRPGWGAEVGVGTPGVFWGGDLGHLFGI